LNSNRFTGTIPAALGDLTSLEVLYLDNNPFNEGQLPPSFKNLTNLLSLTATQCNLVGDFPNFVWSLKKLQQLYLFTNNITGDLVIDGFAARSLTFIDLSENKITGVIPEVFGSLENLTVLNLFMNNFSGEVPATIGRLPLLSILMLHTNRLNGTLPPELGKQQPGLIKVEADYNEFTGAIPEGLCTGGNLQIFTAKSNQLNGSIPAGLANCATLGALSLDNNQLSGDVPEALWTKTQLYFVTLQSNQLTGSLPGTILLNLSWILIGSNQFGGKIPASVAALKVFTAENNQFSGAIPASFGDGMPLLQKLNLSGNHLSDGIPRSAAKLSQLTQLDLSRNQLTGDIPADLGNMPVLSVLDLSSNRLSGNVPQALAKARLTLLNLSSNQLSGQVPAGFATGVYNTSFLDNPGLCTTATGLGYLTGVRSCAGGSQDGGSSGGVSHGLRAGLLAAGAALLLIAAAFAFFVVRDVRKRRRVAKQEDWRITPFVKDLGFGEAPIFRGLTEENLIGRGGSGRVYRIAYTNRLNGRAGVVAVKQIQTAGKLDEKLEREFASEAGILGNLRHNNIVRLLCCLSSAESKLLVYDYMDNGSLDRWLHGDALVAGRRPMTRARSARREPLDWPARLRVAVSAAQGLCYMHHECEPPIVHRDVKTSNILLDSEFRAKIADFGLARILAQAGAPETMSAVAGSFGYMAPGKDPNLLLPVSFCYISPEQRDSVTGELLASAIVAV
jgi:Leucine-rich repeat (LRR) protein